MNKRIRTFILAIITLTAFSCSDNGGHDHSEGEHEEEHHAAIGDLVKDGENKWKANKETTMAVYNMQKIMKSCEGKENAEAYAVLNSQLNEEFNYIFEKCNMTGEAHNQLHNFLHPMMAMFEGLESGDVENCKKSYADLTAQLAIYSDYFE